MAFGRGAKLEVVVAGDTRQLDRTLTRTEARLKKFGRNVNTIGGASIGRAGLFAGGVGGAALLGRGFVNAAREAEVILGQTSVAVEDAGLSWAKNAAIIDAAATRISKSSAFDDEAVLQSFGVFVRGQKDVAKSLELSELAADVARGRYTDLASATQLVNKAAMGQVGALRRAGIQIDSNATSAQALDALQKAYSGSAKKYADSSVASAERLSIAWENLKEQAGGPLSNAVAKLANGLAGVAESMQGVRAEVSLFDSADFRNRFADAFGIEALVAALRQAAPQIREARNQFIQDIQGIPLTVKPAGPGAVGVPSFGQPGFKPSKMGIPATKVSNRLVNQELDARLRGSGLRDVLVKQKQFLESALADIRLSPAQEIQVKQALVGIGGEIAAMDEEIKDGAREKAQAAQDAKERIRDAQQKAVAAQQAAHKRAVEALKAQAAAFRDQADDIKSAVLDKFDTKEQKISNSRALADAKESLRVARMIGAPSGIKDANRQLVDAKLAIERQGIVDKAFRVTEGPKGPVNALTVGGITININGAQDPKAIADQVLAAIRKRSKQTAGQSRGRTSGNPMHA